MFCISNRRYTGAKTKLLEKIDSVILNLKIKKNQCVMIILKIQV
ncbi:hypothetical protein [Campylobacter cuniculorum]|nr:hypothetical protein [Campylobacter cuniculorum]